MNFEWLKSVMPRGLYGRAALIMFLPVVVVTVVVTLLFLQRHFEDVTRQMSEGMSREILLVDELVYEAPDPQTAQKMVWDVASALGIEVRFDPPVAAKEGRIYYDFSGRVVTETIRDLVPAVQVVDLHDLRDVVLVLDGPHGPYEQRFSRKRVSASNPHQLLVVLIGTSLLMTVIATIFLRNQMRPIRRLARVAEAYGRGRVLPYRPSGATEVRQAGTAFMDMRNRLERQNEQRGLMLSGISHDLRTPLTRLRLGLSMLSPDYAPDSEEIDGLVSDVTAMGQMVDAFLAHARSTALERRPTLNNAHDFLQQIIADAQRGGLPVTTGQIQVDPQAKVTFRADSLRRAIENLIGNGVRYGTRVQVDAALGPGYFRISIEDDGPGIPAERREEATRPFTRLDPSRNQNMGQSMGLGLSIATDIARAHGGQLRLGDSEHLGGLRADIVLPR